MKQEVRRIAGMFVLGGLIFLYSLAYAALGLRSPLDGKGIVVLSIVLLLAIRLGFSARKSWVAIGEIMSRGSGEDHTAAAKSLLGETTLKLFVGTFAVLIVVLNTLSGGDVQPRTVLVLAAGVSVGFSLCLSASRSWRQLDSLLSDSVTDV